ncbi:hypothetical protein ABES25_15800 [Bacillus gobiensis]|uniref:hypothetical protein n=1 Tax=Bacillus gobiensis TaxID=1441095 RepID=UPI003D20F48F
MFDPTVFENLKVAIENQIYDLDNLSRKIKITNRIDRLDMSVLSREFAIQFSLLDRSDITAEIRLVAPLRELAAEIMEVPGENPGCILILRFYIQIINISMQCELIQDIMQQIWSLDIPPTQTLRFVYGREESIYMNTIELEFNRKINEDHMGDIPNLIDHVLRTLSELSNI